MTFDIREIPFSIFGSYLAFSYLDGTDGTAKTEALYMRSIHSKDNHRPLFRIAMLQNGEEIPFEETATPSLLILENSAENARCEIAFDGAAVVRIRLSGCTLRLYTKANLGKPLLAYPAYGEGWEINAYSYKMMVTPLLGQMAVDAPWISTNCAYIELLLNSGTQDNAEFALEEYKNVWPRTAYDRSFDTCVESNRQSFSQFLAQTPAVPKQYAPARELAAYVNWSAVVRPAGYLKRNAMLMSKNVMSMLWSWDHCFNAMANAEHNPAFAFDQYFLPFTLQDETGSLPDRVGDETIDRNFVKPPIHGLALHYMMAQPDCIDENRLREAYGPLQKWTEWWFFNRDFDGDGIPQYNHGNDCGWDNSTAFIGSPIVEGADLSAFLVIQLETLAEMARILGRQQEAAAYVARAEELLAKLLKHFTINGQLQSMQSGTHAHADGDSLFEFMPLMLGRRLPQGLRDNMITQLKDEGRFLTAHGLASESLKSRYYDPDGYWRGPIWAPSTWLLVYGLRDCGETVFADRLARAFCDMCADHGFAENFDAITGDGLVGCGFAIPKQDKQHGFVVGIL